MAGIRAVMIEVLQSEIAKLDHEIRVAKKVGLDHREDRFEQAAAQIASARSILESATEEG